MYPKEDKNNKQRIKDDHNFYLYFYYICQLIHAFLVEIVFNIRQKISASDKLSHKFARRSISLKQIVSTWKY